jgi:protein involved in ribonucleotide reduction
MSIETERNQSMKEASEIVAKAEGSHDDSSQVRIVYFSSTTNNTHNFVQKVGYPSERVPIYAKDGTLNVDYDYVLVVPTYGGGKGEGAVPKQIVRFLNDETNRNHCKAVIAGGNINFGEHYCLAGKIISNKLQVPYLYSFELMGMPRDVRKVQEGLKQFWENVVR